MKNALNTVKLPDGQVAIVLTEQPSKQLGIVDVATVRRLAQMLEFAPFAQIKDEFMHRVRASDNLVDFVQLLRDEFNFHTTVNLLREMEVEEPRNEREPDHVNGVERT